MAQSLDPTGIETEASLQPDILQSVDLGGQRLRAAFGAQGIPSKEETSTIIESEKQAQGTMTGQLHQH